MKLWIRSQDKMHLCECDRLMVWNTKACKENQYAVLSQFSVAYETDDYIELGIYESKERALEVLNDIHNTLTDIIIQSQYTAYLSVYDMSQR